MAEDGRRETQLLVVNRVWQVVFSRVFQVVEVNRGYCITVEDRVFGC